MVNRILTAAILFCTITIARIGTASAPTAETQATLAALQARAQKEGWKFQIGYDPVMDAPIEDVTGFRQSENWDEEAVFYHPRNLRLPSSFDWRKNISGGLPPIKNQGSHCGSCWAFSVASVFESVLKIRDHASVSLSEQQLIDCDPYSHGCGGGSLTAHELHVSPGAATEDDYPYEQHTGYCRQKSSYENQIERWGYVGGRYVPSVRELKNAIYQYGPVAATVTVTDSFRAYRSGIYNACDGKKATNHMINLVGWDDKEGVWILRNSWGKSWGEKGYMRIPYGCNRVGELASFVIYKPSCALQPKVKAGRNQRVRRGQSVQLGEPAIAGQRYHWTPEEGLSDPSAPMPVASPTHDTTYTLHVRTQCGSAESSVRVSVEDALPSPASSSEAN